MVASEVFRSPRAPTLTRRELISKAAVVGDRCPSSSPQFMAPFVGTVEIVCENTAAGWTVHAAGGGSAARASDPGRDRYDQDSDDRQERHVEHVARSAHRLQHGAGASVPADHGRGNAVCWMRPATIVRHCGPLAATRRRVLCIAITPRAKLRSYSRWSSLHQPAAARLRSSRRSAQVVLQDGFNRSTVEKASAIEMTARLGRPVPVTAHASARNRAIASRSTLLPH